MTITFLRHAEVEEPYIGKYNGHIDIGLSAQGIVQTKKFKQTLNIESFDSIYCSDLLRTRETLALLKPTIQPIYSSSLREKSWGEHEGKSFQELIESGLSYENFQQWIQQLDGESIEYYTQKVIHYVYTHLLQSNAHNVLVLTHSGFIKTLLSYFNKLSLEEAFSTQVAYLSSVSLDSETMRITIK